MGRHGRNVSSRIGARRHRLRIAITSLLACGLLAAVIVPVQAANPPKSDSSKPDSTTSNAAKGKLGSKSNPSGQGGAKGSPSGNGAKQTIGQAAKKKKKKKKKCPKASEAEEEEEEEEEVPAAEQADAAVAAAQSTRPADHVRAAA